MAQLKDFDDSDIISVDSKEDENVPQVDKELNRGKKIYTLREINKRNNKPSIAPLYENERKARCKKIRPAIYKCFCYIPKITKYEHHCHHFGNIQLDRDILTTDEHISYLAQPKKCRCRSIHQRIRCYFVKRYLPNCTARIDSLAVPNSRFIEHTWKNFSKNLSVRQLKNLSKYLMGDSLEQTYDIERAIMLVQEERYQKKIQRNKVKKEADKIKKCIIERRKTQIREIVWGLFEIMKDFLMSVHDVELQGEMRSLSNIILWNITKFSCYEYPSDNSKEFLDKFLVNLSDNITIWMEKFTTNFGFAPLFKHDLNEFRETDDVGNEHKNRLPIHDYIPASDSGDDDMGEEEEEEEGEQYECEIEESMPGTPK